MVKPAYLHPGNTIGIVSPASPVKREKLEEGIARIEARGYRVVLGEHVLATSEGNDYLAGADEQRAADLNVMFADKNVDAIFCSGGGYGSMRMIDRLDWRTIAANPKLFVGFSDITSLHLALARHANLVTMHGKMVAYFSSLEPHEADVFWRLLEIPEPFGTLPAAPDAMTTLVPGTAEGELAGGCLCLLAHSLGSDFAPDFTGKLVLIEDVGEAIYRADRFLIQLRNAGLLQQAAGFLVGAVTGWEKQEADPPRNTPDALWQDIIAPLGKPCITGFPFGHVPNPLTLPLGVRARLDADAKTLILLESATQ